ncbi:hypothetical protein FB470_003588 [Amycolatopsis thermophila]|uniref:Uncharacterized protein n=1 Tax=Amycolatopsis thermophila TaxID=206084 RepID=A0ABU0EWA4_9PSEU|nr:hypothetical protein [Amycolatopsis thermophila]
MLHDVNTEWGELLFQALGEGIVGSHHCGPAARV